MKGTRFSRREIKSTTEITIKNVTSFTLFNLGNEPVNMVIDGVATQLPANDPALFYAPPQYDFDGDGFPTDIEMTVELATKAGSAILDYRTIKIQDC